MHHWPMATIFSSSFDLWTQSPRLWIFICVLSWLFSRFVYSLHRLFGWSWGALAGSNFALYYSLLSQQECLHTIQSAITILDSSNSFLEIPPSSTLRPYGRRTASTAFCDMSLVYHIAQYRNFYETWGYSWWPKNLRWYLPRNLNCTSSILHF